MYMTDSALTFVTVLLIGAECTEARRDILLSHLHLQVYGLWAYWNFTTVCSRPKTLECKNISLKTPYFPW